MNERNMLNMILGGGGGGVLITGTTAVTGSFENIVINEDAVFESIIIEGVDVVAARGFTAKPITAGMLIGSGRITGQQFAEGRARITSIKLVSGSVIAY